MVHDRNRKYSIHHPQHGVYTGLFPRLSVEQREAVVLGGWEGEGVHQRDSDLSHETQRQSSIASVGIPGKAARASP